MVLPSSIRNCSRLSIISTRRAQLHSFKGQGYKTATHNHHDISRVSDDELQKIRQQRKFIPSPTLEAAWPRLQEQYQKDTVGDNDDDSDQRLFRLLNQQEEEWLSQRIKKPIKTGRQPAAVLVLLCTVCGVPSVLLTRRAAHLTSHAAEMAFVGGHFDPAAGDHTLVDTALREAAEELLPAPHIFDTDYNPFATHVRVFGQTTSLPSLHGTPVTPILAVFWPDLILPLTELFPADPSEVDLVLAVPLEELLANETLKVLPSSRYRMNKAPTYPTPHGEIWGLTAFILRPLLHRLLQPAFNL